MEQVNQAIERLTKVYVKAQFSPEALGKDDQDQALAIWQRLRRQLFLARGLFWLRQLIQRETLDPEKEILE
jgi:hypothetical protein